MLGIMGAMNEEVEAIVALMAHERRVELGGRTFYVGHLHAQPVVVVGSRIGKVAAATTATILLERFAVERVLFTGLAGAIDEALRVGDIVVASAALHHDLDARPLFGRFEIPLLGVSELRTDDVMSRALLVAAQQLAAEPPPALRDFGLTRPAVHHGLVISGDQFIASREQVLALRVALPDALAVEMEGAAVAQVCHEHQRPFAIVRVISDTADHAAATDFSRFLRDVCGAYAHHIVGGAVQALA